MHGARFKWPLGSVAATSAPALSRLNPTVTRLSQFNRTISMLVCMPKRARTAAVTATANIAAASAAAADATEALEEDLQCPVCYHLPDGVVNQVRRERDASLYVTRVTRRHLTQRVSLCPSFFARTGHRAPTLNTPAARPSNPHPPPPPPFTPESHARLPPVTCHPPPPPTHSTLICRSPPANTHTPHPQETHPLVTHHQLARLSPTHC